MDSVLEHVATAVPGMFTRFLNAHIPLKIDVFHPNLCEYGTMRHANTCEECPTQQSFLPSSVFHRTNERRPYGDIHSGQRRWMIEIRTQQEKQTLYS